MEIILATDGNSPPRYDINQELFLTFVLGKKIKEKWTCQDT